MNQLTSILVGILALVNIVLAQPDSVLIRHYAMEASSKCKAICETENGGFLLVGNGGIGYLVKILRINQDGDSLWSNSGPGCDLTKTIIPTADGGFVLAGYFPRGREIGWNDLLLFRLNENGETVWSRAYGAGIHESEHCYDMVETRAGGYALAGFTHTYDHQNYDLLLLVTDESGDSLWYRTYAMPPCELMLQMDDGGFLLAGRNFLFRTDESGDSLWSRAIAYRFTDMIRAQDGDIILAGYDNQAQVLMRINQNCDSLWLRHFGSPNLRTTVTETGDHGFLLAGYQEGDLVAIRTDENGDSLWSSTYFGGYAGSESVVKTSDGHFAFGGYLQTPTARDFLFIKSTDAPFSIENPLELPVLNQPIPSPPTELTLLSAFPNPFNSSTTISYTLPKAGWTTMEVVDVSGRLVERLSGGWKAAGRYREVWRAEGTPNGAYLIQLDNVSGSATRKVVLIK